MNEKDLLKAAYLGKAEFEDCLSIYLAARDASIRLAAAISEAYNCHGLVSFNPENGIYIIMKRIKELESQEAKSDSYKSVIGNPITMPVKSSEAKSVNLVEASADTDNAHGCLQKGCTLAKYEAESSVALDNDPHMQTLDEEDSRKNIDAAWEKYGYDKNTSHAHNNESDASVLDRLAEDDSLCRTVDANCYALTANRFQAAARLLLERGKEGEK